MATAYVPPEPDTVIIRYLEEDNPSIYPHSGWLERNTIIGYMDVTGSDLSVIESNNKFINLLTSLNEQFSQLSHYYNNQPRINKVFSQACSYLLELNPDKISVELTYNDSIEFAFKKNDFTFFFELFIEDSHADEVIYSSYYKSTKRPSYAGDFISAINSLYKDFFPHHPYISFDLLR